MRDLKFTLIALAIFGAALALMHSGVQTERQDKATPVKVETRPPSNVDDWVVKPVSAHYLVSAPIDETTKWSSSDSLEERVAALESKMVEAKSDIADLEKGQQDLTKRVEELTAFVEVRAKSGEVRTQAVKVSENGGTFNLNPGERIIAIDGVPVASSVASGGSSGSFTQSTRMEYGSAPVAPQSSGGSNGTLSYSAPPVTYSTQSYTATTMSSPAGTTATVQPRQPLLNGPLRNGGLRSGGPLRSGQPILPRRAAASAPQTCVGPNCPN